MSLLHRRRIGEERKLCRRHHQIGDELRSRRRIGEGRHGLCCPVGISGEGGACAAVAAQGKSRGGVRAAAVAQGKSSRGCCHQRCRGQEQCHHLHCWESSSERTLHQI